MTFDYTKAVNDFNHKVYHDHGLSQDDLSFGVDDSLWDAIADLESWEADADLAKYEMQLIDNGSVNIKYPVQMPTCVLTDDVQTREFLVNVVVEASSKIEAYIPTAQKILADFLARRAVPT